MFRKILVVSAANANESRRKIDIGVENKLRHRNVAYEKKQIRLLALSPALMDKCERVRKSVNVRVLVWVRMCVWMKIQ